MADSLRVSKGITSFILENRGKARIEIVGSSMLPLLRAGMVLDVERLRAEPKIGDILVFHGAVGLIAHRMVRNWGTDGCVTSGDNAPDALEFVDLSDVVGKVVRVWSDAKPGAKRVDSPVFTAAGRLMVWTRPMRATLRNLLRWFELAYREPRHVGAFRAIVAATMRFTAGDFRAGLSELQNVSTTDLVEVAHRHGMVGAISRWLEVASENGLEPQRELRSIALRARMRSALLSDRVVDGSRIVAQAFAEAGIECIFLKGAARIGGGEPTADLFVSTDIDVLVAATSADAAVEALTAVGYQQRATAKQLDFYDKRVHHRAPLFSTTGGLPVEIHVCLTIPGSVSQRLDFETLIPHTRIVHGRAGALCILDDVASALHLAYHGRDLTSWKDVFLLAKLLARLSDDERAKFNAFINRERRDRVRLRSVVLAADFVNGRSRITAAKTERRYLQWVLAREDFPLLLRKRAAIVESVFSQNPGYYRGFDHAVAQIYRWAYNIFAVPTIVRWLRSGNSTFEAGIGSIEPTRWA